MTDLQFPEVTSVFNKKVSLLTKRKYFPASLGGKIIARKITIIAIKYLKDIRYNMLDQLLTENFN